MSMAKFLSSSNGRVLRIAVGMGLIATGQLSELGTTGDLISLIGAVPLSAGTFDFCLIGKLFFGTPLRGEAVRSAAR